MLPRFLGRIPISAPTGHSAKRHFHIIWLPTNVLDWEPFDTRKDAEDAARDYARKVESYSIEEFNADSCPSPVCEVVRSNNPNI
jgi:hypothetical protein